MSWSCTLCSYLHSSEQNQLKRCFICGEHREERETNSSTNTIHSSGGWVIYNSNTSTHPIEEWCNIVKPSSITSEQGCIWLSVDNPLHENTEQSINTEINLAQACEKIQTDILKPLLQLKIKRKKIKEQAHHDILEHARNIKYTTGKWCLFCSKYSLDESWKRLAEATYNNELGISIKVPAAAPSLPSTSSSSFNSDTLISIYLSSFDDEEKINKCLLRLLEIKKQYDLTYRVSGFKPDIFSALQLNSTNEYKVPVTMWQTMLKENTMMKESTVVDDLVEEYERKRKATSKDGNTGNSSSDGGSNKCVKKKTNTLDHFFDGKKSNTNVKTTFESIDTSIPDIPSVVPSKMRRTECEQNAMTYLQELYEMYEYDFDRLAHDIAPYFGKDQMA
jgi:hypothetical protein